MNTLSSWASNPPQWSFDSIGHPTQHRNLHPVGGVILQPPHPPTEFPVILHTCSSSNNNIRRQQNSSGSSGLGSSDEITYSPVTAVTSTSPGYFSNNIYGIENQQNQSEFSTFRPALSPLYANQYFKVTKENPESKEEQELEEDEDEGINTMTPPKTPAEDYSAQFGDQMETSSL